MTTTGTVCMAFLVLASVLALFLCSVTQNRGGNEPTRRSAPQKTARPELPGEPVIFRTAEQRLINCRAERARSIEDAEIYGERALRYERQELACALVDQLLAAGAIAFREDEGVLRAELRAVMPQ